MGTTSIRDAKLAFWQAKGKNVLLLGLTGVGKTEIIRESLEKNGYKFGESVAYYSTHAGDFVGDPSTAQVILFDDLTDPLAQKAAHEVVGLKVWKGKPVTAQVWGSYTVQLTKTDKKYDYEDAPMPILALFDVTVEVPYRPHHEWFTEKFGKDVSDIAIRWWDELAEEYRYSVSPRKLAQALTIWQQKGDMRDVLPLTSNVSKLTVALRGAKKDD